MKTYTLAKKDIDNPDKNRFVMQFGRTYQVMVTEVTNCVELWLFDENRRKMPVGTPYSIEYGGHTRTGTLEEEGLLKETFPLRDAGGACTVKWSSPSGTTAAAPASAPAPEEGERSRGVTSGSPDRSGTSSYTVSGELLRNEDTYLHAKLAELMNAHENKIWFTHPLVYDSNHPKPGTGASPTTGGSTASRSSPVPSSSATGYLFKNTVQLEQPGNSDVGNDATVKRLQGLGYPAEMASLDKFKADEGLDAWSNDAAAQYLIDCINNGIDRTVV